MTCRTRVHLALICYNDSAHVEQAVLSLMNQNYSDFQLFIFDDNSTDSTWELLQQIKSKFPQIEIFKNKKRLGMVDNYNLSFKVASKGAEYFAWVAGHDFYDPSWLSTLVKKLDEDPLVVLAYCWNQRVDKNSQKIREERLNFEVTFNSIENRLWHLCFNGMNYGNMIYGLFRVIKPSLGFTFPSTLTPDRLFLWQLSSWGKLVLIPKILFFRRFDHFSNLDQFTKNQKLLERQKKSLFACRPWLTYLPWPLQHYISLHWKALRFDKSKRPNRMLIKYNGVFVILWLINSRNFFLKKLGLAFYKILGINKIYHNGIVQGLGIESRGGNS
jgi:glycosyltransferase involved in cell wall biosynthesis